MFIKEIRTRNNLFIYDVNTNAIFELGSKIYDLVKNNELNSKKINAKTKKLIDEYGVLKSKRLKKIKFRYKDNDIKKYLSNNLSYMLLNITEDCNLRCKYCIYSGNFQNQRTYTKNNMKLEIALKAIDFFLKKSEASESRTIGFYGGEPLLNFDTIKQVVEYANQKCDKMQYTITTNGTLLTEKIIDFFKENNFKVGISLDGYQELHDRYRVDVLGNGTFSQVKHNIELIKRNYPSFYKNNIGIITTLTSNFSFNKLNNFFVINDIKARKISQVNTNGLSQDDKNEIFGNNSFFEKYLEGLEILYNKLKSKDFKLPFFKLFYALLLDIENREFYELDKEFETTSMCLPSLERLFITTSGSFRICESMDNSFDIGNIYDGFNYSQINYLVEEYLAYANKKCINCWAVRLCSLCWLHFVQGNSFDFNIWSERCESYKKKLELFLKYYIQIKRLLNQQNQELKEIFS
jgi:uncharacterized protein